MNKYQIIYFEGVKAAQIRDIPTVTEVFQSATAEEN